jgi:hypothetical protein
VAATFLFSFNADINFNLAGRDAEIDLDSIGGAEERALISLTSVAAMLTRGISGAEHCGVQAPVSVSVLRASCYPTLATETSRKDGARSIVMKPAKNKCRSFDFLRFARSLRMTVFWCSHPSRKNRNAARVGHPDILSFF